MTGRITRLSRRTLLTDFGVAGIGLIVLGACGGSSDSGDASPSSASNDVESTDPASTDPARTDPVSTDAAAPAVDAGNRTDGIG